MTNNIYHSSLGSHWKKKDHKYIDIVNGRYIYPENVGTAKSARFDKKAQNLDKAVVNSRFNPIKKKRDQNRKALETQARLDAEQRRLDAVNRMNQREKELSKNYVTTRDENGRVVKIPKNSSAWKEAEAKRAKEREEYLTVNKRLKYQADGRSAAKRQYYREKALTKERQAKSGHDEKGFRIHKVDPTVPSHDARGFRNNNPVTSTDYDERGFKLSNKVAKQNRAAQKQAAKAEADRRREVQKQGVEIYKQRVKDQKKAQKLARKEFDKQLPRGMKLKRDVKRGKKALKRFLHWD